MNIAQFAFKFSFFSNPQNDYNGDTDIPYISHERETAVNDDVVYYNTNIATSSVKIHPNPSYDVGIEASGGHYVVPNSPKNNKTADNIYYGVTGNNTAADDIYDDVSGVHEYLAVT